MKNCNFATLSCWQSPSSGIDEFHPTNFDISMMMGNNINSYPGGGMDNCNFEQLGYGSNDVPSQCSYFPAPAMESTLMSTTIEYLGLGFPPGLVNDQWSLPGNMAKSSDTVLLQQYRPTMKDVTKCLNGARLGQRNSLITSLEASKASKKRKAIEQLLDAEKLKAPSRRSQKLSDKITVLQELVSPYGKTDTASVLQEACIYIKIIHQEIRRLSISYFDGRSLQPQLQVDAERQGDLQSRGLCLVPLSIMKRLTKEISGEQHQTAARAVRRP